MVRLNPCCGLLYLVVDDTLLHKRGKHVYALGWFRDAVASTAKRVATASGNHWVVVGLAIRISEPLPGRSAGKGVSAWANGWRRDLSTPAAESAALGLRYLEDSVNLMQGPSLPK